MADSASSLEASLCLSGFFFGKVIVIESFAVNRLLRVRLAVSGVGFRVSIGSVESLPARRPSGMLVFPVLSWPFGPLSSACRVVCSFSLLSIRFVRNDQWRAQARRNRLTPATPEMSYEFR
ncbi:hypothetical protein Bca4012_064551 [Brassica carinata]